MTIEESTSEKTEHVYSAYPAFDKMSSAELLEYAADIDKAHKKHMTYIRALAKAKAGLE